MVAVGNATADGVGTAWYILLSAFPFVRFVVEETRYDMWRRAVQTRRRSGLCVRVCSNRFARLRKGAKTRDDGTAACHAQKRQREIERVRIFRTGQPRPRPVCRCRRRIRKRDSTLCSRVNAVWFRFVRGAAITVVTIITVYWIVDAQVETSTAAAAANGQCRFFRDREMSHRYGLLPTTAFPKHPT